MPPGLDSLQTDTAVSDATPPVAMQLRGTGGLKIVRVRFRSDDEWIEHRRCRSVIVKRLGRGASKTAMQGAYVPPGESEARKVELKATL